MKNQPFETAQIVWDVYSQIMVSWLKLIDLTKRLNQSHQQKSQLKWTINYL